jgi:hypothetical protein
VKPNFIRSCKFWVAIALLLAGGGAVYAGMPLYGGANAPITYVASYAGQSTGAPGATLTTPAFTAIPTGASVVGMVNSSSSNLTSVTDNATGFTNSYIVPTGTPQFNAFGVWNVGFYGINIRGNPTTLTFHYASPDNGGAFAFDVYNNVNSINNVAANYSSSNGNNSVYVATAATSASAPLTTTATSTIWSFSNNDAGGTIAAGAGYTLRNNNIGGMVFYTEDQANVAPGSVTAGWTDSVATRWTILAFALH